MVARYDHVNETKNYGHSIQPLKSLDGKKNMFRIFTADTGRRTVAEKSSEKVKNYSYTWDVCKCQIKYKTGAICCVDLCCR